MTWPFVGFAAVCALFGLGCICLCIRHRRQERKHLERLAEMAHEFEENRRR